jgi:hypothetical protein
MRLNASVLGLASFAGAWKGAFCITNHATLLASQLRGGFDGQAWLDAFHQRQGGHAPNGDMARKRAVITRALQSHIVAGDLGTAVSLWYSPKLVPFCEYMQEVPQDNHWQAALLTLVVRLRTWPVWFVFPAAGYYSDSDQHNFTGVWCAASAP